MVEDGDTTIICTYLADRLQQQVAVVREAYRTAYRNVCTVIRRQILNTITPCSDRPLCHLIGEDLLLTALRPFSLETVLFIIARVYDVAHIALCKVILAEKKKRPYNQYFRQDPSVDLQILATDIKLDKGNIEHEIWLEPDHDRKSVLIAKWAPVPQMSFDRLPVLTSLCQLLPGEHKSSHEYAGVGGGGGSDIISVSLLAHLLRRHGKKMDLMISTRTWATGSQGQKNSKLGIKRVVYNHGGPVQAYGRSVPGTFRVKADTYAEGRNMEAIPLEFLSASSRLQMFMVLDQGESSSEIPDDERANLKDQLQAVLIQAENPVETVLIVDTGGDVFGGDMTGSTTPDQDFRVQQAMSTLFPNYNLVTVVLCPGVDAPIDASEKALKSGGMVYKPTKEEQMILLELLAKDYKMDGSDPSRFGKTTMSLQARFQGVIGWTSLDFPEHVVDTWENPWTSFVYIRECMSDIILMPTTKLLPLIAPKAAS